MKRGTPRHPKTRHLARTLEVPIFAATGILEMLWHFAAEYSPQGDIGRYSDAEISDSIGWTADASVLIEALVAAKYLERDAKHRLLVHDFHDHAENGVKKRLARNALEFLTIQRRTTVRKRQDVSGQKTDASSQNLDASRLAGGGGEGGGEGEGNGLVEGSVRGEPPPPVERQLLLAEDQADRPARREKLGVRTLFPTDLALTDRMRRAIEAVGCGDPDAAFQHFRDVHTKNASKYAEWEGAVWRTFVANHNRFGCPCQQAAGGINAPPRTLTPSMAAVARVGARIAARDRAAGGEP